MAPQRTHKDRRSREWQKVRAGVLAGQPQYCYLCRGEEGPIRYDLPYPHPLSPSVDHVIPAKRFEHLPDAERKAAWYDRTNLKPCHKVCNDRKKDSPAPMEALQCNPGQEW